MEKIYIASVEIVYLGWEKFVEPNEDQVLAKAYQTMEKADTKHFVGRSPRFYFNDIRLDFVEHNRGDEYIANFNAQYLGYFEVTAEDPDEASEIAEDILKRCNIRKEFGNFELSSKYIYDLALKED